MNDSANSGQPKDKPKPRPKPLHVVAVDHDYVKHGNTGGITMANKPKK